MTPTLLPGDNPCPSGCWELGTPEAGRGDGDTAAEEGNDVPAHSPPSLGEKGKAPPSMPRTGTWLGVDIAEVGDAKEDGDPGSLSLYTEPEPSRSPYVSQGWARDDLLNRGEAGMWSMSRPSRRSLAAAGLAPPPPPPPRPCPPPPPSGDTLRPRPKARARGGRLRAPRPSPEGDPTEPMDPVGLLCESVTTTGPPTGPCAARVAPRGTPSCPYITSSLSSGS